MPGAHRRNICEDCLDAQFPMELQPVPETITPQRVLVFARRRTLSDTLALAKLAALMSDVLNNTDLCAGARKSILENK